ncbi:RING-type domain-containing protein [Citrus sinensis]|uniref:RING-type domain-containing protein n=1 Tax=Citrus sinensis TaxID=2711 RepID=A0ACB8MCU5_CITSI|nr:RING-type domain-containing protein [Citrus sinensis]
MAASKKFKNKSRCTHPFCQECIAKYIQVKVQDDNTAKIECTGLDYYVLGFERIYCPNRNCMALVVNESERNGTLKKAQCPSYARLNFAINVGESIRLDVYALEVLHATAG